MPIISSIFVNFYKLSLYHISVTQPVVIVPVLVFCVSEAYFSVLLSVFGQHTVSDSVHPPPGTAAHRIQRFANADY